MVKCVCLHKNENHALVGDQRTGACAEDCPCMVFEADPETTDFVSVDLPRDLVYRIRHKSALWAAGADDMKTFWEGVDAALARTHSFTDMTGYCQRCGADADDVDDDDLCDGGASLD